MVFRVFTTYAYMCIFSHQRTDRHHGQYFVFKIFLVLNSRSVTVQQIEKQKKRNAHCSYLPLSKPLLSVIAHSKTTQTSVYFFAKKSDWMPRESITLCRTYTKRFFYRRFFTRSVVYDIEFKELFSLFVEHNSKFKYTVNFC